MSAGEIYCKAGGGDTVCYTVAPERPIHAHIVNTHPPHTPHTQRGFQVRNNKVQTICCLKKSFH